MNCRICGRSLNQENDLLSINCGGDCWSCIGEIEAQMGYDPSFEKVSGEFELGVRPNLAGEKVNKMEPLTEKDKEVFLAAWANFERGETKDCKCTSCGSLIFFERRGTAILHHCSCGKFTGSLRGL